MQQVGALWCTRGVWSSDFLKQAEGLNFNDKFDILLEKRLSDVVEQGYTMLYGESQVSCPNAT
jgi:hypothetical protein